MSSNIVFLTVACLVIGSCSMTDSEVAPNSFRSIPYQRNAVSRPNYQYQQYQPQPPYYQRPANSRSYYNPYEFQQPSNPSPYSDYNQYYVPPVEYYNRESQRDADTIFSGTLP